LKGMQPGLYCDADYSTVRLLKKTKYKRAGG